MSNQAYEQAILQYVNTLLDAPLEAKLASDNLPEELKPLGASLIRLGELVQEKCAFLDEPTGVWNRACAFRAMDDLWEKGRSFVLGVVQVDNLDICYAKYGAMEVRRYVRTVANIVGDFFSDESYVFRMAEDRFLVLSLSRTLESMTATLDSTRFQLRKISERLLDYRRTFSYGCAYANAKEGVSYQPYLEEAEQRAADYAALHGCYEEDESPQTQDDLDIQGLRSRAFDAFAAADDNRYLYLINMHTKVSRWSISAVNDFGLPGEYVKDFRKVWLEYIHPDDQEAYRQEISAVLSGQKQYHQITYRARTRNNQYVVCTGRGYMLRDKDGNPDYFAGVIVNRGVIENIDPVTNLYNVYMLMDELRRYKNMKKPVSLLMFGANQFRRINNSYGFGFGNQVLRIFSQKVLELLGGKGRLFRLNGVKFCLLMDQMEQNWLEALYERISDIARNELVVDERLVRLTLCAGSLSFEQIDTEENTVLAELEYALSVSKKERQGRLNHYDESHHSNTRRHLQLIDVLIHSVLFNDFHGFFLEYQPQVQLEGQIIGAEALIRWKNETWGRVPPNDFIPILENDSCFYELGLWILQTALREVRPIVDRHPEFSISVNVSYRQLEQPHFKNDVLEIVNKMGFPTGNLTLELTEHCRSIRQEVLTDNLNFLRAAGIRISADDFGTGYSSLALLRDLPFDAIKIDRTFISHIVENNPDQIIVRSTIQCAKDFGISVCIEGVEDVTTLVTVGAFQPDYYQGYLYSKPISLEALLALFEGAEIPCIKVDPLAV